MAFNTNPINFPNLTSKATPIGGDIILIADSAANNTLKQALVSSLPAGAGSGSFIKIASATAANVATLDFAADLSATYDSYLFIWEDFQPVSNATTLGGRVGTGGGPTYSSTTYFGTTANIKNNGITSAASATSQADFANTTTPMSNSATATSGGWAYILNTQNASDNKVIQGMNTHIETASSNGSVTIATVFWQTATALTSFRWIQSSGNLNKGTWKLYGVTN